MKRKKISKRASKKVFRKTADKINSKNLSPAIMRGGYRM